MKKKIIVLFGTMALIAVLNLNVIVSKNNEFKTFSLENLLSLSEAQSEGPGGGGCEFWCYSAPNHLCYLQNGPNGGFNCWHRYPW